MGIDLSIEAIVKEEFFEIRKCRYNEQLEAVNSSNFLVKGIYDGCQDSTADVGDG